MAEVESRFWSKVDRGEPDECWEWTASTESSGYGYFKVDGGMMTAHRMAMKLEHEDPADSHVLHKCDNKLCVNPAHLYLGDHRQNMEDAKDRGRIPKGEDAPRVSLTEEDVREMRREYEETDSVMSDLSEKYGVSTPAVSRIINRKRWGHVK